MSKPVDTSYLHVVGHFDNDDDDDDGVIDENDGDEGNSDDRYCHEEKTKLF